MNPGDDLREESLDPPNHVIEDLYLEINNIAQGVNMGIFVLVLTNVELFVPFDGHSACTLVLALTSLLVSIVFWARYYFDTAILARSFTLLSATWFFLYVLVQGISISLVGSPTAWLVFTGLFLFFGSGFYVLNLQEIARKQRAGLIAAWPNFVAWQRRRGQELFWLSLAAFGGAGLISWAPAVALPAALLCLAVAIWQLVLTNDYRRLRFIRTGV